MLKGPKATPHAEVWMELLLDVFFSHYAIRTISMCVCVCGTIAYTYIEHVSSTIVVYVVLVVGDISTKTLPDMYERHVSMYYYVRKFPHLFCRILESFSSCKFWRISLHNVNRRDV